jgi:polysaccharide lyase-like protein
MGQVNGFSITRTSEVGGATGSYAAKIVSSGGNTGCSCPRMQFEDGFRYVAGREVWLRGAWYFPNPSAVTWSRMMNLISYTGNTATDYYTGLVIEGASGQMLVRSRNYQSTTGQKLIFPARPIPVGRWFTVTLRFKLSPTDGQALNEWYVDGQLVGSNTVANMHNSQALIGFQGGMPYFLNGINTTVYFDDPALKD